MKFKINIKDKEYSVGISKTEKNKLKIKIDQEEFIFRRKEEQKPEVSVAKTYIPKKDFSQKNIVAPIAGLVSTIFVKQDDFVKRGDKIIILSSMKMENEIISEFDGKIKKIFVSQNQEVKQGDSLAKLE
jgi:biotin carboxyl carrier protein